MIAQGITEAFLLLVIVASALFTVKTKDLVTAALSLSVLSLFISMEFYLLQAPDVAIAEAAVGAVLTTAIYIFAIRATRAKEEE